MCKQDTPLGHTRLLARPCRVVSREGTGDRIHFTKQDTHVSLDHNIDSSCATAIDFERLLEVFLQQNNTPAQRTNIVLR